MSRLPKKVYMRTGLNAQLSLTDRLDLLRSIAPINLTASRLIQLLEVIAAHNKVLQYFLENIQNLNLEQQERGLKQILCKLTPKEFATLFHCCQETTSPGLRSKHNVAAKRKNTVADAADTQIHGLENEEMEDELLVVLLGRLSDIVAQIEDISDVGSDFADNVAEQYHHIDQGSPQGTATDVILPFAGVLAIYQAGYEVASNNAFLRNAYREYQKSIKELTPQQIEAILDKYPDDPLEQIEQVKLKAKANISYKMLNNTRLAGTIYSVFFAAILSFFIPSAFLLAIGGTFIGFAAAKRNSILLEKKIDRFIRDKAQLDDIAVQTIQTAKIKLANKKPLTGLERIIAGLEQVPFINLLIGLSFRSATLQIPMIIQFSPMVYGLIAVINSAFTWQPTRSYLASIRHKPTLAMRGGFYNNVTRVGLTSTTFRIKWLDDRLDKYVYYRYARNRFNARFGRSQFYRFLLDVKGLDQLEKELDAHEIPPNKSGKWQNRRRRAMSSIGIWEGQRFNDILERLYNSKSAAADRLLADLEGECQAYVFEQELKDHLQLNRKVLGLQGKDLAQLLNDPNNLEDYQRLLRSYLEYQAANNSWWAVFNTGLFTSMSAALIIMATGVTFFQPLIIPFLAAATAVFVVGTFFSLVAAYVERRKTSKALQAVTNAQFIDMLDKTKLPQMHKFLRTDKQLATPTAAAHSLAKLPRLSRLYKPKNKVKNMLDSLQNTTAILRAKDADYKLERSADKSVSLVKAITDQPAVAATKLITLTQNNPDLNLHDGLVISWQSAFSTVLALDQQGLSITLANMPTTVQQLRQRVADLIAALKIEFETEHGLDCPINFEFKDFTTANAIYQALKEHPNDDSMDKVRAFFGFIRNNGKLQPIAAIKGYENYPYFNNKSLANMHAFDPYLVKIHRLEKANGRPSNKLPVKRHRATRI